MITLAEQKECRSCHRPVEIVNEGQICKECTEKSLLQMRCPDCGHTWKHPGLAAWCPLCGNAKVTSDDKIIDEWMWRKEAEKIGIIFVGMTQAYKELPSYPLFQDHQTGSFCLHTGETVAEALARKRLEFKVQ